MAQQKNAQDVQAELLQQLYELRTEFYDQLQNVKTAGVNDDGEISKLQEQNRKLTYRVGHLTNAINELLKSEKQLQEENRSLKNKVAELQQK